jgi:hypothetical protein
MEMSKKAEEEVLSDSLFWEIIAECKWESDYDDKRIRRYLCMKYNTAMIEAIKRKIRKKSDELQDIITFYEEENGCRLVRGSDDSFYYFTTHTVGRGREVYEKICAEPNTLVDDSVEGFYAVARGDTIFFQVKETIVNVLLMGLGEPLKCSKEFRGFLMEGVYDPRIWRVIAEFAINFDEDL